MSRTHRKQRLDAPPGFFAAEAAGLAWLEVDGGPHVAQVEAVTETELELEFLSSVPPTRAAAHDFGRRLASLHRTLAPAFGAVPPGGSGGWFFGPLHRVFKFDASHFDGWAEFFTSARLTPLRDLLASGGYLDEALEHRIAQLSERVQDFTEEIEARPVRVHGDLWSGNLMWAERGVVLIDPAAHGNHPYTDLAMLELFGCPYLADIFDAYFEHSSLQRPTPVELALHQVFPVGMHVVIFGAGYRPHLDDLLERILDMDV